MTDADDEFYGDGNVFRPERWLEEPLVSMKGLTHSAYGPGPRICPALHISNHIMYGVLTRLILDFRISADERAPPVTDGVHFGPGLAGLNKTPSPFKLYFTPRGDDATRRISTGLRKGTESSS
jgi:phenylacetate 2-hydroxylase